MKKLLLFFLAINPGIQCMESDKNKSDVNWKSFLIRQIEKNLNDGYSDSALADAVFNFKTYPKESIEELEFFKDMIQLCKIHGLSISDLPVAVDQNKLNLLEAQFFAGYSEIADLLEKEGCKFSDIENLITVINRIDDKAQALDRGSKKNILFKKQLETAKQLKQDGSLPVAALVCNAILRVFQIDKSDGFIYKEIQDSHLSPKNLSRAYFYNNEGMKFNILGYSLVQGFADLTKDLLEAGVDPNKLDEKNQSVTEIFENYKMSANQLNALIVLEKYKEKQE